MSGFGAALGIGIDLKLFQHLIFRVWGKGRPCKLRLSLLPELDVLKLISQNQIQSQSS
jgi:hypothetical protein